MCKMSVVLSGPHDHVNVFDIISQVVGVQEDDSYMGRITYFHSVVGEGYGIELPYFKIRCESPGVLRS